MSRMICIRTPKSKPARRTNRPAAPFAEGLVMHSPAGFGPVATPELFESDEDRRWDVLAMEFAMQARLERGPWL